MNFGLMIDSYRLEHYYTFMSEILVPGLSLPDLPEQEQEEDLYSEERFVSLLLDLSERSVLYYCPYDRATLRNFFQQISVREQASLLPLPTVHQFISELKQRNRMELAREAEYYEAAMGGQLRQGIQTVSRRELLKTMDRYDGDLQLLTEIMRENSKEAEFVGCELVLELIQQVRQELEDAVIPELSITKLKTLRLDSDRAGEGDGGEERQSVAPLFQEIGEYEVKRLLGHYGCLMRRKLAFYRQFIGDQEVLEDVDDLLTALGPLERALADEVQQMIDANDHLNTRGEEFTVLLGNLEAEQALQGEIIEGLKQQGQQLREELAQAEERNRQQEETVEQLETALKATQGELAEIGVRCEGVEEELAAERRRYEQVFREYCLLAEDGKRRSELAREEQTRKIFSNRSLKEQLEDTAHRLQRVLSDRDRERREAQQAEEQSGNRIALLEGRLEELERELREKNEYLCEYIRESKLSCSKMSAALRTSKISLARISVARSVQLQQDSEPLSDSLKGIARESIGNMSVVSVESSSLHNIVSVGLSKISRINLAAVVPIPEVEESSIQDISDIYNEQNILGVLKEDLQDRPSQAFKKKGSPEVSPSRQEGDLPKGKYFFSKGAQVNVQGLKFQTFLLLTSKRFCYFDTKVRLERFLPVTHIREVTFLVENPNLFIIKPANTQALLPGKHITNDMIFCTRNAPRLQAFLAQLRQTNKILISVKKAENAWLKVSQSEYNLGMGVRNSCHPCRLALAHQPVFYADFKGDGLFPSRTSVVLVVQPMGVLCFEGEEPYELEEKRELFAWLPLSESLRVSDKRNTREAPERKLVVDYGKAWDKCWQIVFQSKDDTRRFKRAVEQQMEKNLKARQEYKERTVKLMKN